MKIALHRPDFSKWVERITWQDIVGIFTGSLIAAAGIQCVLVPASLLTGGVTGLAIHSGYFHRLTHRRGRDSMCTGTGQFIDRRGDRSGYTLALFYRDRDRDLDTAVEHPHIPGRIPFHQPPLYFLQPVGGIGPGRIFVFIHLLSLFHRGSSAFGFIGRCIGRAGLGHHLSQQGINRWDRYHSYYCKALVGV